MKKLRVARVSTVPFFVITQLRAQIDMLYANGVDISIVTSKEDLPGQLDQIKSAKYIRVDICRDISLFKDAVSLVRLFFLFRSSKFDIVHSTTPKAGLLCSIAAFFSGIKIRLHTFTGQPWATVKGPKAFILKLCDKIISILNTHCYADSETQRQFLIDNGVIRENKISVLGCGSLAGVDLLRFSKNRYSDERCNALRGELQIPEGGKIILFVGRVTQDKGIRELMSAFKNIALSNKCLHLLLVGPLEENGSEIVSSVEYNPVLDRIHQIGFCDEPEKYMALADLLCLPSYREGFGTVVIEAAAMGVPTVGTHIYGLSDAIIDGVTGVLVPPRDVKALSKALGSLLNDLPALKIMGCRAAARAVSDFDSVKVSKLLVDEYERFIK